MSSSVIYPWSVASEDEPNDFGPEAFLYVPPPQH